MFWYNGKLIHSQTLELEIDNPGLLYGATLFTTLRVYHNSLDDSLTNWLAHCSRLLLSLKSFHWQQPDWKRLRVGAEVMITQFPVLRITLFPDGCEWITGRFLPSDLTEKQNCGIEAILAPSEFYRSLPRHKTGNYLAAWLAKNQTQNSDSQEAILVDAAGNWLETSTGNLWGWQNNTWWTPPLEAGILPGIMREQIINSLKKQHQEVKEEPWTPKLVEKFAAIAYCNSVVETVPIHTVLQQVGKLEYNPKHPSFQQLRQFF